jgi:hypothetical protein
VSHRGSQPCIQGQQGPGLHRSCTHTVLET